MPRERQELFRESNSKEKEKIIVLAFEGNITEKEYFEELKSNAVFNDKNKSKPDRFMKNISQAISEAKGLVVEGEEYPSQLGSYVFKVVEKMIK